MSCPSLNRAARPGAGSMSTSRQHVLKPLMEGFGAKGVVHSGEPRAVVAVVAGVAGCLLLQLLPLPPLPEPPPPPLPPLCFRRCCSHRGS